ncbi:type IV secretory system Conjugative DNA transfer family protein [Orientia chuto str. Dubai]|uniref:Type IV secretory system Conjugative DNA transfer family protein n=1 Tax=Orientia chuto str. Dubai TaxID=1359168 RepID=A0A0F3MGR5_9RICK|nr:type IV secretion system DNA-binding domain-containing protein [Candidatus Orientia mediorientalis]KJV54963.1 type IV secretory system Conjugative DNA transfer family protein [Orientia chuto str. Dubai]
MPPETSSGIQSTLGKNITSLQYLKPGGKFSIKEWFSNETGWLFITASPAQRATLQPQLEEIYGSAGSASMLDLFNSKFIFRVSDQQTAYKSALTLGEEEIIETQENLSYGSNTMRDGVNIHTIERKKLLVMPSEIMNLPNLTCYVKLAGNFPITKLKMKLQTLNIAFTWAYKLLNKLVN